MRWSPASCSPRLKRCIKSSGTLEGSASVACPNVVESLSNLESDVNRGLEQSGLKKYSLR